MTLLDILLIGIALAMDCFAVSTAQGLAEGKWKSLALLMAFLFGFFQGGMPLIGYFAGSVFSSFFSRYAPFIALALLSYLGGKMVWESLHEEEEESSESPLAHSGADGERGRGSGASWSLQNLLLLSVATSIDALATGVIFIPCPEQLWLGIAVIALCSFVFALTGYLIGVFFGKRFRFNVELLGGVILILIGLKIFVQGVFL